MPAPKSGPMGRAHLLRTDPSGNLAPWNVEGLMAELEAYPALVSPLLYRTEQRYWTRQYLQGQLLGMPRQSIQPMVLASEGLKPAAVCAMQEFISEGAGENEAILKRHQQLVDKTLGAEDRVVIVEGRGLPKQGQDSVGVARQYCGALGKMAKESLLLT